jgi:hypothetical protein
MITFKGLLYSCLDLGRMAVRMLIPGQKLLARYGISLFAVLFLSIAIDIIIEIILALYKTRSEVEAYLNQ